MKNFKGFTKDYFEILKADIDGLDLKVTQKIANLIWRTYRTGKTLFIAGNGGSAATASHMANDFAKGLLGHKGDAHHKPFKAIALTDNFSLISAWANDTSFEEIFSRQLECLAKRGDLLIAISASGNSPNILKAVAAAKKKGVKTIGLCGFDGGQLHRSADIAITASDHHYGRVEDVHLILDHLIVSFFCEKLKQ